MKCEKCGDDKVYVAGGEGLGQVCLSCAFQGADYASKPDRFEIFDLKKYQDKAREMRDEIWRKFSEDTSKYISNESPCDDSMRERPDIDKLNFRIERDNNIVDMWSTYKLDDDSMRERPSDANTWDGKIYVLEGGRKVLYEMLRNVDKPQRDDMRCPKCRCAVNFMESDRGEISDSAIMWIGECDDCDAEIEFHFRRTGFPGGYKPITFGSNRAIVARGVPFGEITLYNSEEVDWDAELKKLPKRA